MRDSCQERWGRFLRRATGNEVVSARSARSGGTERPFEGTRRARVSQATALETRLDGRDIEVSWEMAREGGETYEACPSLEWTNARAPLGHSLCRVPAARSGGCIQPAATRDLHGTRYDLLRLPLLPRRRDEARLSGQGREGTLCRESA
jgi:hypothetical protein